MQIWHSPYQPSLSFRRIPHWVEMSRPFLASLSCSVAGWTLLQEECELGLIVKVDPEELKLSARTSNIICRAQCIMKMGPLVQKVLRTSRWGQRSIKPSIPGALCDCMGCTPQSQLWLSLSTLGAPTQQVLGGRGFEQCTPILPQI